MLASFSVAFTGALAGSWAHEHGNASVLSSDLNKCATLFIPTADLNSVQAPTGVPETQLLELSPVAPWGADQ